MNRSNENVEEIVVHGNETNNVQIMLRLKWMASTPQHETKSDDHNKTTRTEKKKEKKSSNQKQSDHDLFCNELKIACSYVTLG